ncbi:O-antigen ligase family protein [Thermodesulfovibrio yellowstonii]|uniref:O-antigen ligase family protein n=1 Tax=Thermodesulfovibrio yellowstonii TaxID=28262 RepID=UPI003C7CFE28
MPPFFKMIFNKLSAEKILLIILSAVFLFIMHIFLPNIGGVIAKQVEYVIWFASGTVVFIASLKVLKERTLKESPLKIYILLFITAWIGSTVFNQIINLDYFLISSAWLVGGFVLWFAFHQYELTQRQKLFIFLLIFLSAVIESLIGIIQFFGLYRYIPVTPSPETGMVGGVFQQKNLFASWIATGLIVSLYLVSTAWLRSFSSFKKILFFVGIFLLSLSLIIAQSRTGLLGIVIAMVFIFIARRKTYKPIKKTVFVWLMLFIAGVSAGFFLLSVKDQLGIEKLAVKKIKWFSDPEQVSYRERILMYETSFDMFKEKPFTGQGFSNFGSLYMYYQAKVKKSNPDYYKGTGNQYTHHPHNELSLIVAESGIFGILGVLCLLYGILKFFKKIGYQRAGLYTALLTPFLIHMMLEYPLHLSVAHWFTFVLIGAMATSHFLKKTEVKIQKKLSIAAAGALSFLFILFSVHIVKTFIAYNQLVIWYIEYSEGKNAKIENLIPAKENLYLRNWAKPMYMFYSAENALKDIEQNQNYLYDFLNWSETEKKRIPIPQVFQYDAYVLFSLGKHFGQFEYLNEAVKSSEEGLALYPENQELKNLRKTILVEAFRNIFKNLKQPEKLPSKKEPVQ